MENFWNKYKNKITKGLIIPVILGLTVGGGFLVKPQTAKAACGGGYLYCQPITLLHGQVGNGTEDESNFPVLISTTTDSSLAVVSGGGVIQHVISQTLSSYTGNVPADLIFTSDSACATKLKWEVVQYNQATGLFLAFVNIPTLSHTADTTIYTCYDNSLITTFQGDVNGTWNSNYLRVWHLGKNGNDSTTVQDSPQSESGTTYSQTGKFGLAVNFNGSGWMEQSTRINQSGPFSFQMWYNSADDTFYKEWMEYYQQWDGFQNGGGSNSSPGTFFTFHFNSNQLNINNPSINAWHDIVVTVSSATTTGYMDGSVTGTTAAGTSGSNLASNAFWILGSNALSSGNYNVNGDMQEARISKVELSAGWIKTEYNNESSPTTFETWGAVQQGGTIVPIPKANITIYPTGALYIKQGGQVIINNQN